MRIALTMISVAAALVMIGVSAALNYAFLASFGRTTIESAIIGSAGLAADIIKACLPWFVVLAWRKGRFVFVGTGVTMFALLSTASLAAAVGFGAELRGRFAQERQQLNDTLRELQGNKARIEAELSANGTHRSPEVIRAEIAGLQQDRSWASSKECSDVTLRRSRDLCRRYFHMIAELRSANAASGLNDELTLLSARIVKLQGRGASEAAEPQVTFLAALLHHDVASVRLALVVLTALVIELGSGLGLYLASHHSSGGRLVERRAIDPSSPGEGRGRTKPNVRGGKSVVAIERFCIENLAPSPASSVPAEVIYAQFRIWCVENQLDEPTHAEFVEAFSDLALELGLRRQANTYKDIKMIGHVMSG